MSHLQTLERRARALFEKNFQTAPQTLAAAPGRVNLIGEHIDYCHGYTLPCAIPRHTIAAAAKSERPGIHLNAGPDYEPTTIHLDAPLTPGAPTWANYPKGVIAEFQKLGIEIPHGLNIQFTSDIPIGAGLSSSAALEVATATLLEAITGHTLTKKQKALLCQSAEHHFAGVPCGIMDQFASTFGEPSSLTLIDCLTQEVELIPFPQNDLSLIITNSMVSHSLADGEYAKRHQQTQQGLATIGKSTWREVTSADLETITDHVIKKRAHHVITEIKRTLAAAQALKSADHQTLGKLMTQSHQSLKNDFQVSCPELDTLVEIANQHPATLGSRMTGGGFGGSTITLCKKHHNHEVITHLEDTYTSKTNLTPQILSASPSQGTHPIPQS